MLGKYSCFFIAFILSVSVFSQSKKALSIDDLERWNHLSSEKISADGNFVAYEVNPYKGDGELRLWNAIDRTTTVYKRGKSSDFSPSSEFLAFLISPQHDTIRQLKLKKTKKDKLPKDSLAIVLLNDVAVSKFERVRSFKLPTKNGNWIAWQSEDSLIAKKSTDTARLEKNEKKPTAKKKFDKNAPDAFELVVHCPIKSQTYRFPNTTEYKFSENGDALMFVSQQNDSLLQSALVRFNTTTEIFDTVFADSGIVASVTINNEGSQWAFIHSADTIKEKVYSLYIGNDKGINEIVNTQTENIPKNWTVSEHGKIYFSELSRRLYFGVAEAPRPEPKDTLLDEEKVVLDLWSWTDGKLQPEQLVKKKASIEKSFLTAWDLKKKQLVMLEDTLFEHVRVSDRGDGQWAVGFNYLPYEKIGSWEMPYYKDVYTVNVNTGDRKLVLERIQSAVGISPFGKYLHYFNNADSAWYIYDIRKAVHRNVTGGLDGDFYIIDHDFPNEPGAYGLAGYSENDERMFLYDRYDIWQIDPAGKKTPLCLTAFAGREQKTEFKYCKLDYDKPYVSESDLMLLAFNTVTKQSGYYRTQMDANQAPQKCVLDDYKFYKPIKARLTDKIIWKKSSYVQYPDIWCSDLLCANPIKVSETNAQQNEYKWGSVELFKWITAEGTYEEGLLYKPENFDPNKKYPMMVYFYRLYSDEIHSHRVPKPSRSVINFTYYASNDYVVFVPNIRYKIGYPGESAVNYVVSGTVALLNKYNYIDKDRIGLQGQSWGGYEVAYIITETNLFAAASAGAPVSNMTSAYGAIRWASGMSRMFQYEETQSRIGGTLWDKPLQYIENSPLFFAPKVQTPLLIRHNDGDGAVPWYQGIEYFVALRRLNKPVWMLNYNGGPHNEKHRSPNSRDLSIRMMQFFDHYLKGQPAPVWMTKGIPATKKGKTMGYEIDK